MSKRILLSMFIILMAAAAMGGATMAWFTASTEPIENVFTAGTVSLTAGETLTTPGFSKDNWNPGDCAEKEFIITNTGTKAIALRGVITTQWYEKVGNEWVEWSPTGPDAVSVTLKNMSPAQAWEQRADGNWYYTGNSGVIPGTFTANPPAEVSLTLKVCLDGPTADNQYQGKRFVLTATFEAIQASHSDQWDWDEYYTYNP